MKPFLALLAAAACFAAAPTRESLAFEPNRGQAVPEVRYLARARGMTVFLTAGETVFAAPGKPPIRMKLHGASAKAPIREVERAPGIVNYFQGNDPSRWLTAIPRFAKVERAGVYPGIDLVYHADGRDLEYDFVVKPGADPGRIELAYEGAESLALDDDGGIALSAAIRQRRPRVYQEIAGRRVEIEARYRIREGRAGFEVARYDRSRPLVIDPVVAFSTYLGGAADDAIRKIAVTPAGDVFVAGSTASSNFPLVSFAQGAISTANVADAFVSRFNSQGALVSSTYVGGTSHDEARALVVDVGGTAFVAGETTSANFPVVNPYQTAFNGGTDAFVFKISPQGTALQFSTYMGGEAYDSASSVGLDGLGSIYIAGATNSAGFPVINQFANRQSSGTAMDGFVVKFIALQAGALYNTIGYSTYFGGTLNDTIEAIAVDNGGSVFLLGETESANIPLQGAYQSSVQGSQAMFLAKLNPGIPAPILGFGTYLGGSDHEIAGGIFLDAGGAIYVAGSTWSGDFPLVNPYRQRPSGVEQNAIAGKFTNVGQPIYLTYLSDRNNSEANAIVADPGGNAYITGRTRNPWPLIDPPAGLPAPGGGEDDAFLVRLGPAGNTASLSAQIGGAFQDYGVDIAVDGANSIWLAINTASPDLPPTVRGLTRPLTGLGPSEGFLMKIDPGAAPNPVNITSPAADQTLSVSGVTVTWQAVSGAAGYSIRVYGDPAYTGFARPANFFGGSVSGANATSTLVTLPDGDFIAAVKACVGGLLESNCGAFSYRKFKVRQPRPGVAPSVTFPTSTPTLTGSTQTLRWTQAATATSYEVLVVNLANNVLDLQIRVSDLQTIYSMRSGQYQIRVRGCSTGCGPWSEAVNFVVDLPAVADAPPTILSATVTNGNRVTVNWTSVPNADLYLVQVVQPPPAGPGGGALTVASQRTSGTTIELPVPAGAASVFVAACNGDGCRANSAAANIAPTGPNGTSPTVGTPAAGDSIVGPVIVISWNRIAGDNGTNTTYRLFVQDLGRQSAALDILTKANFYGAYFSPGTRYDVAVIANPGAGQQQGPSSGFSVRGDPPQFSTLVSPTHTSAAGSGNVGIGWTPLLGSAVYQYYVAAAGRSEAFTGVTSGLRVDVPLSVLSGSSTVYNAIVRACRPSLTCDADSDTGWYPWSNQGGSGVVTFTVGP